MSEQITEIHKKFNQLLAKMGADRMPFHLRTLSDEDFAKINSYDGLEVKAEDIERDMDPKTGIIKKDGQPVVLFIKNTGNSVFQLRTDPKGINVKRYHLFGDCPTVKGMITGRRYNKYVYSYKLDGKWNVLGIPFIKNFWRRRESQQEEIVFNVELGVCINCLKKVKHPSTQTSQLYLTEVQKKDIRMRFNKIEDFFKEHDQSPFPYPKHSEHSAGTQIYGEIYERNCALKKKQAKYTCQHTQCKEKNVDFTGNRRLLHCHHKDGDSTHHDLRNLKVLCIHHHRMVGKNKNVGSEEDYKKCMEILHKHNVDVEQQ